MKTEKREKTYPLSAMQQGMLYHNLYTQNSGVDIEQLLCRVREPLNQVALKQAWQQIIARHPILRTSWDWQNRNQPQQIVHPQVTLPYSHHNYSHLSATEQQQQIKQYLQSDRHQGFELAQAPLMRLAVLELAATDYQIIWTYHHGILDGRSLAIILREIFTLYDANCQAVEAQLPAAAPYHHYIEWLQQQDWTSAQNFWQQQLQGFNAPTPLLGDTYAPAAQQPTHPTQAQLAIQLSSTATTQLQSLAQQHQLTLNTLVQAAWALLLSRYSGETDVVFGATRACRHSSVAGAESMVGLLINTVPVRVTVSPEMPLLVWLKQLRQQWISLREYEHTPLVMIGQWSDVAAGMSLFDSLVVFENYQLPSLVRSWGGRWQQVEVELLEQTNYPLTLAAYAESELLLQLKYDQHRFERATMERMLGHLQTVLESMALNPWQCLGELPLLTPQERYQLLVQWNDTHVEFPGQLCIHQLFEAQVELTPDAVAVVFEHQQLTYCALNHRANQLAHYLQTVGIGSEVLVGICVERSLEMVVGLLGILKAGGAYLPLDPAYPQERLAFMLEDAQVSVLLTQERLVASLPQLGATVVCLDSDWETIAQQSEENPNSEVAVSNLAYIIYTSGSTGKPKGVQVLHRGVINFLQSMRQNLGVTQQDVLLSVTTISFDIAVLEIFLPIIVGARVVLVSREVAYTGTALLARLVNGTTMMQGTPATWNLLLEAGWQGDRNLKILCGGEPLNQNLANRLLERCASVWNLYGPTETTIWSTIYQVEQGCKLSIGRPIANTQIYLLDRNLEPVPIGVPGELYIGGDGVARGYLNRPDLTAERFITNPFANAEVKRMKDETENPLHLSERLYKTGDLARYLPNGNIEFLGRIDHQVKIRGFRIEVGEIEAVLLQHSKVLKTVVVAREDQPDNKRLVAYIVLQQQQILTSRELRCFLKEKLPDYMLPSVFVMLETLPLTPNGKIDRRALPAPHQVNQESEETFVTSKDELELQLTKIWEEVLGIQPISLQDNFFDLGGHSLLAARLFTQIEQTFHKNLPLAILFQTPTIEELASILRQEKWSDLWSPLVKIQSGSSKPPLFCIHGGGFNVLIYRYLASYLGSEQPVYGLQARGMDGKETPHTCIEDMAAEYIQHMRTVQPQGPYFLAGLSNGGNIALEMAQQLHMQGQQVALLAMFDSYGPDSLKLLPPIPRLLSVLSYALRYTLPRFIAKLLRLEPQAILTQILEKVRIFQQISDEQNIKVTGEQLKVEQATDCTECYASNSSFLEKWIDRLSIFILQFSPWAFIAPTAELHKIKGSLPEAIKKIEQAHNEAQGAYVTKAYSGQITLFQASERPPGFYLEPQLGWGAIATEGVEIYQVPGHHSSIITSSVLAQKLKTCLEQAQAKAQKSG